MSIMLYNIFPSARYLRDVPKNWVVLSAKCAILSIYLLFSLQLLRQFKNTIISDNLFQSRFYAHLSSNCLLAPLNTLLLKTWETFVLLQKGAKSTTLLIWYFSIIMDKYLNKQKKLRIYEMYLWQFKSEVVFW